MDKNAVLLSYDLLPILKELIANGDADSAADLTVAIIEYDKDEIEPEFKNSMVMFLWRTVVKPKLDEYKRKYEEKAKRSRENGAKGGRPKKQSEDTEPNETEITQKTKQDFKNLKNPLGLEKPNETSIDKISIDMVSIDKDSIDNKEKTSKKAKEPRHKYGEYKNVLLSDSDLMKLQAEFPTDWEEWIEKVSGYCQQYHKSYSDYLATIRNWARRDREKAKTNYRPYARNDVQAGYQGAMNLLDGEEDG